MTNLVCPLDFRYGRKEIKEIFSEATKLSLLLKVEAALAKAHAEVGNIPRRAAREIEKKASLEWVKLERVKLIEQEIKHDIGAVVRALTEVCEGEAKRWVHFGATSYDLVDSANALQLVKACELISLNLFALNKLMLKLAKQYKSTPMIGRTHGQHAIPITFGLKLACYCSEIGRQIERLEASKEEIRVGKMLGAVGTGAALGEHALEIQAKVMEELGLKAEEGATQIVGRDRYIQFLSTCANLATTLEKIAQEIRNLQRTEIGEVAEGFEAKQMGSSAMPHKRNPINCEQICGLARVIRSNLLPAWENALQWHERDLCNSASERFILAHTCILIDWIIYQLRKVFQGLEVYPERMKENLDRSSGLPLAEAVMTRLINKGVWRQDAYELAQRQSAKALAQKTNLSKVLKESKEIRKYLTPKEIHEAMDPKNYLGKSEELVEQIVKKFIVK
jgi:adenylosuccinate lyase